MSKFKKMLSKVNSNPPKANVTTTDNKLVAQPEIRAVEFKLPSDKQKDSNEGKEEKFKE
jgi:hypothetical protein